MTRGISADDLGDRIEALAPDVVGVTAITPSIYRAEVALRFARDRSPKAMRVLGGVHAAFMFN